MGMKAYFMIDVADEVREEGRWADAESELETIPEVETIEPVSGSCDFLVKADVPIRAIFVANKIRAMEWVKRLRILRVEPIEPEVKPTLSEIVAEQRKAPKVSEQIKSRTKKG